LEGLGGLARLGGDVLELGGALLRPAIPASASAEAGLDFSGMLIE